MVEDIFPNGLKPVESTISFPYLKVTFEPLPKHTVDVWENFAQAMRGYTRNVPTRFARKVALAEGFNFARRTVRKIQDPEMKLVQWDNLMEWWKDIVDGIHRGTFDPYMYLARCLLHDPYWYPKAPSKKAFEWSNPLPEIDIPPSHVDDWDLEALIAIPTGGNTGFPYLKSWNDARRTPEENKHYHQLILDSCDRWKRSIDALPEITPRLVKAVSPLLAGFHRSQGKGRVVFALAKSIAFWMMPITQELQQTLDLLNTVWFGGGNRNNRYRQMMAVIKGDPGTHTVDGDDHCVSAGDAIVSGDWSSFDASVVKIQHLAWLAEMEEILPRDVFRLYKAAAFAAWTTDAAVSVGLFKRVPMHGVVSGTPDTHLEDSWNCSARIGSCNWRRSSLGIEQMSRFGIYRPDRQYELQYTATMAQLVVSDAYPNAIIGLVPRVIRALFEREDWSAVDTVATEDVRIVQILANLYSPSMPWLLDEVCHWVRKHWDIRVTESQIKSLLRWDRENSTYKYESYMPVTGKYETKALSEVYRLLTV
jgi:hypothetical protein